jgi:hypothetical protein
MCHEGGGGAPGHGYVFLQVAPASAQTWAWPAKPVRIVNTFGRGFRASARMVADQLATTFKQQFFVETRAGATEIAWCRSWAWSRMAFNLASTQSLGHDPIRIRRSVTIRYAISPTSRMWAARRSCSWSAIERHQNVC